MGPRVILFRKKIKNRSHGTIHTFKNYFVTVFFFYRFTSDPCLNIHVYGALFSCLVLYLIRD